MMTPAINMFLFPSPVISSDDGTLIGTLPVGTQVLQADAGDVLTADDNTTLTAD